MGQLADALKRSILTIDLERLPGLAPVWDQRTDFIPAAKWRRMPSTLCYSARWYGQTRMMFGAVWDDGPEALAQKLWDLFDRADIVVTYNGKRADIKWCRGDWLKHGLPQPRPWKDVDLYVAGNQFGYPSRSLAHLCQQLGVEGKDGHYDMDVAERAAAGHRQSQRDIRRYNSADVAATERVYERLRPWLYQHPHVSRDSAEITRCNRCGSDQLTRLTTDYLATQIEYAAYRCDSCGGVIRSAMQRRVARSRGVQ